MTTKSRRSYSAMIEKTSFPEDVKAYLHSLFDNDTRPYVERSANILYEAIAGRPDHPFEDNLRVVKEASNRMFKAFYEYYRPRHLEKCEAFEVKIKTSDIRLIGLYLQGMLHYCKQCGKACVREFCSSSCSATYGNINLPKEAKMARFKKMKEGLVKHKRRLGIGIPNKKYATSRSKDEAELFDWIPVENKRHSVRDILPNKRELDIYLPEQHLAIEYDRIYWHTSKFVEKRYHLDKIEGCEAQGITLFHIFENIDDLDIWKSMILARLGKARRISARKCELRALNYRDVRDFLAENHLQGSAVSSVQYGLFYDGELVEVMTFAKPRFARQYDFELVRLCTKKGMVVVGGASRLWTAFRREHPRASVISYANRRFSQGKVYRTLGFSLVKTTAPNYVYIRQEEVVDVAVDVVTRYKAQKHRLSALLGEEYDPDRSEFENMTRAGYERLYDCGNMVFEFLPKMTEHRTEKTIEQ